MKKKFLTGYKGSVVSLLENSQLLLLSGRWNPPNNLLSTRRSTFPLHHLQTETGEHTQHEHVLWHIVNDVLMTTSETRRADPLEQLVSVVFCCFATLAAPLCDCYYCDGIGGSWGEQQLHIWPTINTQHCNIIKLEQRILFKKKWTQRNCANLFVAAQGRNLWNS